MQSFFAVNQVKKDYGFGLKSIELNGYSHVKTRGGKHPLRQRHRLSTIPHAFFEATIFGHHRFLYQKLANKVSHPNVR